MKQIFAQNMIPPQIPSLSLQHIKPLHTQQVFMSSPISTDSENSLPFNQGIPNFEIIMKKNTIQQLSSIAPARLDPTRVSLYARHAAVVDSLSNLPEELKHIESRLKQSTEHAKALEEEAKQAYNERKKIENDVIQYQNLIQSHSNPLASIFSSTKNQKKKYQDSYNEAIKELQTLTLQARRKAEDANTAACTVAYDEEQKDALLIDMKSWKSSRDTLRSILNFVYEGEETGTDEENEIERKWKKAQEEYHAAYRTKESQRRAMIKLDEAIGKLNHAKGHFEHTSMIRLQNLLRQGDNIDKGLKDMKKACEAMLEAIDNGDSLILKTKQSEITQLVANIIRLIKERADGKDISRTELKKISNTIEPFKECIESSKLKQREVVNEKTQLLKEREEIYDSLSDQLSEIRSQLMEEALKYYEATPKFSS